MNSRCWLLLAVVGGMWLARPADAQTKAQYDAARKRLVDEAIIGGGVTDERVVKAMLATPRHEFVDVLVREKAYFDMSLPIGSDQTISSPFIVAYMTESLDPQPTDKVLEIGTGSGYQAAVLSPLVKEVYSIEIVPELGRKAKATLERLKYKNVFTKVGDGYQGWPEKAPFDKIIVTCSPEKVPVPLAEQLREGGLMVVPVGERYQQTLYLLRKKNGKLESEALRPTLFVPMTGTAERNRQVQPDPKNPKVVNGGFEETAKSYVPGWYYERGYTIESGRDAPEGKNFLSFSNMNLGAPAHLLQGLAIDGRFVKTIELSARVKSTNVLPSRPEDFPTVAISFYDHARKELDLRTTGPIVGSTSWHLETKTIKVPEKTREAILRVGLFGATGDVSFDDVRIRVLP